MGEQTTPIVEKIELDEGRSELRVRWEEGYPVLVLGEPGTSSPLPGSEKVLAKEIALKQRNVIVLGERGGGVSDLLRWWREALDESSVPWLYIRGGAWKKSLMETSTVEPQGASLEDLYEALKSFRDAPEADEKADLLAQWASQLTNHFHLIIRDFSVLGEETASAMADALRLICEQGKYPNLHLLIGSTREFYFSDRLFSGYGGLAYCYRFRGLQAPEIIALFTRDALLRDAEIELDTDTIDEILDFTGGQPLLVQSLLRRVCDIRVSGRITQRDVKKACQLDKESPPNHVRFWKDDLRRILADEPKLVTAMRKYVHRQTLGAGGVPWPPPAIERALLVSGWAKLNRLGRWGIASDLHASLASSVLDFKPTK
jgi:hypothetical protein